MSPEPAGLSLMLSAVATVVLVVTVAVVAAGIMLADQSGSLVTVAAAPSQKPVAECGMRLVREWQRRGIVKVLLRTLAAVLSVIFTVTRRGARIFFRARNGVGKTLQPQDGEKRPGDRSLPLRSAQHRL
jgi:hypothetical protein